MGVITVPPGAEKERKTSIAISEPGYYRIGAGVHTVGCRGGKFTIVDGGSGQYGFVGGTYAADMSDTKTPQWVLVSPEAVADGAVLQFEISCLEGTQDDQLLVRDMEKEEAASVAIAQMSAGVSAQAQAAQAGGAADARGGWLRGV